MRVYVCSDLHCEFNDDGGQHLIRQMLPSADIVVVAGDLAVGASLRPALQLLADKYRHVVYVTGNHDFYHSSLEEVEELRQTLNISNVHWLENETCEVEGIRFAGCTLWFGWHHHGLETQISDFQVIPRLREWVHQRNAASLKFLWKNVTPETVVVTHHLPSLQSVVPRYRASELNCFFACPEAEEILLSCSPQLWVHGHTHDSLDYRLGKTRVLCNPLGYAGVEVNPTFRTDQAIVEL